MKSPIRPRKKRSEMTADEYATASLRKRGHVWWTHFGFKGDFFRFSLGTSDRSKAKREAKRLISLAMAGKITATASSPDERRERRSASLRKLRDDPRVSAARKKANAKRWKNASEEDHIQHAQAIRDSATPERRRALSKTATALWKDDGYRKRITRSQKKYWRVDRHRKEHSKLLTPIFAKPEVQKRRLEGRLAWAKKFLRRGGVLAEPGKRGRKPEPADQTQWFKIGLAIDELIPRTSRPDRGAITAARKAHSRDTGLPLGTCGRYHSRYRRWLAANRSTISEEISSR
jgi:hypothetical protein